MSHLSEAIKAFDQPVQKLFRGQYSKSTHDLYTPEIDRLDTSISGIDGSTVHIFSLRVELIRNHGKFVSMYSVDVRDLDVLHAEAHVPGSELLDFLLNAGIKIESGQMAFEYPVALK